MSTLSRFLTLLAPFCLAGCPIPEVAHCADYDLCPASSGSTAVSTGGDPMLPTGEVQTVTSAGEVTTTTTTTAAPSTTGEPVVPAVLSVMFTPDPLEQVGSIDVEVVAEDADHVRMDRPGFESVELTKGPDEHFHGAIEILSGLSNGTHEASFVPRQEGAEGATELGYYTVALPEAGSEILWDVVPDDGLGQVDALAVLGEDAIVGLGTVFDGNNIPRCYAHRRNLDGSYSGTDVLVLFPEYPCTAVDIETHGETIDLLVTVTGGDGPRWRLATMAWGQALTVLRTGEKNEVAHALARDTKGKRRLVCGTGPSSAPLMDSIDGRVWTLNEPTVELDYRPPLKDAHMFDETVADCVFRGDQLVLVGEVVGKHEGDPLDPKRKRPFVLEIDSQGEPHWIVPGLGPGKTTQGGATVLTIDDQGRAIVGLYTCGDTCDAEPELRLYEPGGDIAWQVTLPAGVSVPFDVTWSPAGYAVIAGAYGTGWSTQFLLQAYVPGTYGPAWTFAKGKQAALHIAFAVVAAPGVVVGAGLGAGGYPAFAFVKP
ncbi:hypothetical protein OV203_47215 [Nannocystis sp. ILAH1]|uniref:hypothetical protein n=1 Tax=Nannocystis sp. ILAH1 TaxID=2996789 RepID=UPI0022719624|nr:hypothetical protein [Nannocystis sp. ILAH1]MCY0994808.1 hypothetical protein [Nannocystis sp. ILAH1]